MASAITEQAVLQALSGVSEPDQSRDLVSLKRIKSVRVEADVVVVALEPTNPSPPTKMKLQAQIEAAVRTIPGVGSVLVDFGARVRPAPKPPEEFLPEVKHVILVGAGKGGVGKSTCAVNLALALRQTGASVGLLDADFYGPSVPLMLGLVGHKPVSSDGKRMDPAEAFGISVVSLGFLMEPNDAVIWRGPMLHGAIEQLFRDVDWGALDYLVIDLPPGTGDIPLSISQKVKATGAVLVTTPQDVSLADVVKAHRMFEKLQVPVLGIVENMSDFICPHCKTATPIFDKGGGKRAAATMGIPCLAEIPLDLAIRMAGDAGKPIVEAHPDSPQAKAFVDMARAVASGVSR